MSDYETARDALDLLLEIVTQCQMDEFLGASMVDRHDKPGDYQITARFAGEVPYDVPDILGGTRVRHYVEEIDTA